MSNTTALAALLSVLALPLAGAPPRPVGQETLEFKDRDHEKLGDAIAEFFEARRETKDIEEKRADVVDEVEKLEKKLKGRELLALTADVGQAFWYSFRYDAQKGIRKGKVSEEAFPFPFYGEDYEVRYATHVPAKYRPSHGPYALVLTLPDKGVSPEQHIIEDWVDGDLRDGVILAAVRMPDELADWTSAGGAGKPGGVGVVLLTLKEMYTKYAVDFDRIFIAGKGAGVAAAAEIAARFPDRFAGVIGRSGDVAETLRVDNFCNLPSFFTGGGSGVTKLQDAAKSAGYENVTGMPEGVEKDVWAWIQQTKRASNPAKVVLVPSSPNPVRAYWIEVPNADYEGKARIQGTIDRATNTVTLQSDGIATATLYFNDVLLDLDKPVKVVCNGVENEDLVPRNLNLALGLFYQAKADPGRVYVNQVTYDFPASGGDE